MDASLPQQLKYVQEGSSLAYESTSLELLDPVFCIIRLRKWCYWRGFGQGPRCMSSREMHLLPEEVNGKSILSWTCRILIRILCSYPWYWWLRELHIQVFHILRIDI